MVSLYQSQLLLIVETPIFIMLLEATILRVQMCRRWNITNKSQKAQGTNFSGN